VTTYLSQWPPMIGCGERGVMGAPRSHQTEGAHERPGRMLGSRIGQTVATAMTMEA